jgi:hypothetical protein
LNPEWKGLEVASRKLKSLVCAIKKKPQLNGKKGGIYLMWKMKFEADMMMKELYEAF